ncbi:MAG: DUF4097 family beta strand repeat-containing protein [Oscillospiraceae bacterium]
MKSSNKVMFTLIIIGLVLVLIGSIVLGVGFITSRSSYTDSTSISDPEALNLDLSGLSSVKLEIGRANINFIPDDHFAVETADSEHGDIICSYDEATGELKILQKGYKHRSFGNHLLSSAKDTDSVINIYVAATGLHKIDIELGVGEISMDGVSANEIEVSHGAGAVSITDCSASECDFDIAVGEFIISDCEFSNMELQNGAGSVSFSGVLRGKSKIKGGVGEIELNLTDSADNYSFDCMQGLGDISINGSESFGIVKKQDGINNAPNRIAIESGVGSISVNTAN